MKETNDYRNSALKIGNLLSQKGPFRVWDEYAPGNQTEGRAQREEIILWRDELRSNPQDVARYRSYRQEAFLMLGVKSFYDIPSISKNEEKKQKVSDRVYAAIGNQYGIEGSVSQIKAHVDGYAKTADDVIKYLQEKVLNGQASGTEITNDIRHMNNPVDLLLVMFDSQRYGKRARFEAKRKLLLMESAAAVDREARVQKPVDKLNNFDKILNDGNVWKEGTKIGESEDAFLYSSHDPSTFECKTVEVLNKKEAQEKEQAGLKKGQERLTQVRRRTFVHDEKEFSIYITTRPKDPVAKVIKMLRRDTDNPSVAVEDDLGFMGILDDVKAVNAFQDVLQTAVFDAGYMPTLSDLSDTLTDGNHKGDTGSSPKTKMRKYFVNSPNRVEIILHTNESFINYYYSHEVGHEGYITRRLYDSGVVALLVPPDIYDIDLEKARKNRLAQIREELAGTH